MSFAFYGSLTVIPGEKLLAMLMKKSHPVSSTFEGDRPKRMTRSERQTSGMFSFQNRLMFFFSWQSQFQLLFKVLMSVILLV